jgi:hypothetical protein
MPSIMKKPNLKEIKMKTLITAIALIATATTASAFSCTNKIENINGKFVYTEIICNGKVAPQSTVDNHTFMINNPEKDREETKEETVTITVATPPSKVVDETPVVVVNKPTINTGGNYNGGWKPFRPSRPSRPSGQPNCGVRCNSF